MTRLLDRIAWEIWYRLPPHWDRVGDNGLRARFFRSLADRCRTAINTRRFIP